MPQLRNEENKQVGAHVNQCWVNLENIVPSYKDRIAAFLLPSALAVTRGKNDGSHRLDRQSKDI